MLRQEVSPSKDPILFLQLAFSSTFFAGVVQASLGILRSFFSLSPLLLQLLIFLLSFYRLKDKSEYIIHGNICCFCRLGFIIDFLSKATLIGFMAGAAIIVSLQQLKALLGITHFTKQMGLVPVLSSVFHNTAEVTCLAKSNVVHPKMGNICLSLSMIPPTFNPYFSFYVSVVGLFLPYKGLNR